jgi:hypothetical protein
VYYPFDNRDFVWVKSLDDESLFGGARRLTPQAIALGEARVAVSEARPALSGSFHVAQGASTELPEARERYKRYFNSNE